jgi:hypothetical protein
MYHAVSDTRDGNTALLIIRDIESFVFTVPIGTVIQIIAKAK